MKTLSEIKQEVAIKNGCESWSDLLNTYHKGEHESFYDEVAEYKLNQKLLNNDQIAELAEEYIKPFRHQLHLGEEEYLLSDFVCFGEYLITHAHDINVRSSK